jgi:hypothetical protein
MGYLVLAIIAMVGTIIMILALNAYANAKFREDMERLYGDD